MRKPTKSSLTRALDKECSRIVRARGICARCGKGAEKVQLQCAHIISRSHRATRFDLTNLLCLCANCHINFAHKNPILFTEFVREYLGGEKYQSLKSKATSIKKWTIEEMQSLLNTLKAIK